MSTHDTKWFQSALNAMRDLVLIKGPRSQLLWANKAFLNYYGMTEEEIYNIVDADHSDPDDTLQYVIDDQKVFDTAMDLEISQEVVTDATGQSRYFHTIKSPIFEKGKVVRSVGVSRMADDTIISREIDHKGAKAFVAPLRSLTSGFPNPMIMVDVKKRIVESSPLWNQCFGDTSSSSNAFFDDVYGALVELNSAIDACLESREHAHLDVLDEPAGGLNRKYSVQISPWKFTDGVLGGATIVATDITELYERTEALQRANDELVQFSYRASHDLKGPLSTVKGLARFIDDDIKDGQLDEARENARKIVNTMERLEETVISILAIAHSELHKEDIEAIILPDLLEEVCDGLALQISRGEVEVQNDFQITTVSSQPTRLRQIIENLISNAIKYYSPQRAQPFVKISTRSVDNGVELYIKDNGIGLPEGAENKIFDLFSRFHSNYEGSGLGLAIVKKHVSAIGGRISIENQSEGVAFRIYIPQPEYVEATS